jgi:perosamine synthetase
MYERLAMMERIPVAGPWITQREIDYVTDAVTNAWYKNANMYHERFEKSFAAYLNRKYAITLPSCTSGLHLALMALGVGPGDEVIVPDLTWIASAAPIHYVGATPVFADVDPASWCLSSESFRERITPQTKALIVVDLYGNMPDMDRILEIASKHNIAVIEDAAEAIGSEYKGKKAGSFGQVSTFSFHGSKTLTTGEGGMLVTDSQEIYDRCMFLRDHGRDPNSKMFWNTEVGYKYKMSSMQAALGLAQLERVDELVTKKREIFAWYHKRLQGIEGITLNAEAPGVLNTYWMVTIIIDPKLNLPKEHVIQLLSEAGVDARPIFYPLSALPAYQDLACVERYQQLNTVSSQLGCYGVNLPSGFNLSESDVERVCTVVKRILAQEPIPA